MSTEPSYATVPLMQCVNRTVVSLDVMGDGRASLDLDLEDGLPHEEDEGEDGEVVDNAIPRRKGTQPQPRFELRAALQQPDALPTEPRRTLSEQGRTKLSLAENNLIIPSKGEFCM
jgi:hypothetical protein